MKNWHIVVIIVLSVLLLGSLYRQFTYPCFKLPKVSEPAKFGPYYWSAIHSIADQIPCSVCREDGKSLFIFAHDLVNFKIGKKIFNQPNFEKWLDHVVDIKNGVAKPEKS